MESESASTATPPRPRPAAWRQALVVLAAVAILAVSGYSIKQQLWDAKAPTVPARPLPAGGAPQAAAKPTASGSRMAWLKGGVRMIQGLTRILEGVKDQAAAGPAVAKLLEPVGKFNGFAEQLVIHPDVFETDYTAAEQANVHEVDEAIQKLKDVAAAALDKGKGNEDFEDAIRRALVSADRIHSKVHKK